MRERRELEQEPARTCERVFHHEKVARQFEFFAGMQQPLAELDEFVVDVRLVLQNHLGQAEAAG